ncbi:hypothetical protein YQE_12042, partial [Dendroctonus ponderosae]
MNLQKNASLKKNILSKIAECRICLEVVRPPVCQCEAGHVVCKSCFDEMDLKECSICNRPVSSAKNVVLEQLLEGISSQTPVKCEYATRGCTFSFTAAHKDNHERDCRFRPFQCEGNVFAGWKCDWVGSYSDIQNHFKTAHKNNESMEFKTEVCVDINFRLNFRDVDVVSFFNGQAYFYYKHFVDARKEKLYWAFQFIGLKCKADSFYYEFEVYGGPIRKFKVSELCYNDTTNIEDIFELEKCVVMSFTTARNFVNNDGKLPIRFRIKKVRNDH